MADAPPKGPGAATLPFPESLCHNCGAPPRYVESDRGAVFIHCPIFARYPPQPVLSCTAYTPRSSSQA